MQDAEIWSWDPEILNTQARLAKSANAWAQVQGGKPKARRALKSEDSLSLSVSATDSEADSLLGDSAAPKRKPGAKRSAPSSFSQPCRALRL
jgi:hypothetical protein